MEMVHRLRRHTDWFLLWLEFLPCLQCDLRFEVVDVGNSGRMMLREVIFDGIPPFLFMTRQFSDKMGEDGMRLEFGYLSDGYQRLDDTRNLPEKAKESGAIFGRKRWEFHELVNVSPSNQMRAIVAVVQLF